MKKTWLLFASLTLAISMLSACNSNEASNGSEKTDSASKTSETAEQETSEEKDDAVEETAAENEDTASTESETAGESEEASAEREPNKTLQYTVDGQSKEDPASLTASDEQNYSLYKLEGYTLTGEEPNKDALYFDENSAVFMRVETISKDDASYEIIAQNMTDSMHDVSVGKEPVKITDQSKLPQGEGISKQIGFESEFELGTVSGIVFEQGNMIVRLTIFDQNTVNLTDAFLKMGETIAAK